MHFPKLRILWARTPYASAEILKTLKTGRADADVDIAIGLGNASYLGGAGGSGASATADEDDIYFNPTADAEVKSVRRNIIYIYYILDIYHRGMLLS